MANDSEALTIVRTTLARMAEGGINDHLGGGFCRYSVDAEWTIPHFEKMLYDNGPLIALYADLGRATGEPAFGDVARAIVGWLVREMRAPDGAFWSSLDADSEGEEGKFYVWTPDEVRALLSPGEWEVAALYFGLDGPPNFEQHAWHLRVVEPLARVAQRLSISLPDAQTRLAGVKTALFAARDKRVHPGRDDKVLTAWNALAIAGLARAARAQNEPRWADLAVTALDALTASAWRDGRLYATRREGLATLNAYLDDHAYLLMAIIEVMQMWFRRQDFELACALADALLTRFEDRKNGGFWFTSHDHEKLFHRTKPGRDGATPSGNGVAAQALIVLGHLANDPRYLEAAERAVRLFAPTLAQTPAGLSTPLTALEDLEAPPTAVLLAGDVHDAHAWHGALERHYRPNVHVFDLASLDWPPPALVKGKKPEHGAVAWICKGMSCLPPIASLAEVQRELASRR